MYGEGDILDKDACYQNTARETFIATYVLLLLVMEGKNQIFLALEAKRVALDFWVRQGKGAQDNQPLD